MGSKFKLQKDEFVVNKRAKEEEVTTSINDVQEEAPLPAPQSSPQLEEDVMTEEKAARPKSKKKKSQGRPKKDITRKQYTITMLESDYNNAMDYARSLDISFAKLVERALKEYIK